MSVDGNILACAGEDGSIVLFDIHNKERSVVSSARKDKDALGWAKEVLIYKADMEEMHQTCQDLESKVCMHMYVHIYL